MLIAGTIERQHVPAFRVTLYFHFSAGSLWVLYRVPTQHSGGHSGARDPVPGLRVLSEYSSGYSLSLLDDLGCGRMARCKVGAGRRMRF